MKISIDANAYIYLTVLLFIVPTPLLVAWFIAVAFHEFCHYTAVRIFGGEVYRLDVGIGGLKMDCSALTKGKEFIAIISGPLGGFILVLLGRWAPMVAICSCVLSIYNMIPLRPLDGGHLLQLIIRSELSLYIIERFILFLLLAFAVYCTYFLQLGVLPIIIVIMLWSRNRKKPCKSRQRKVQ